MDFSRHLVLYSGGADSTHFIEQEPSASHLIHYPGLNTDQTKVAIANANLLNRHLVIGEAGGPTRDGETNQIHALHDTQMALDAGIRALSYGMKGIVLCFNNDDIGIDAEALERIFRRVDPEFDVAQPLRSRSAADIRAAMKNSKLKHVSCIVGQECGHCAKCRRGY